MNDKLIYKSKAKEKFYEKLKKIRESEEYKIWREQAFKKWQYTCQCCFGEKGSKNLQVHHVKSFARYPKLRFDLDNSIVLCDKCHDSRIKDSFHDIYGTKGNTKRQLNKYIKDYQESRIKKNEKGFDVSKKSNNK